MTAKKTSAPKKKPKAPKSGPKGGRPRTKLQTAELTFDAASNQKIDMSERANLETFFQGILQSEINDLKDMKADIRVVLAALRAEIAEQSKKGTVDLRLLQLQDTHQKRSRQISKDLLGNMLPLVKQFKLFGSLKPEDAAGDHSNIDFHLQPLPPASAVVPNQFELGPDAIDPDRKAG